MKLGQVKLDSLMLMYPEAKIPTVGNSLTDVIYELKSNKSLAQLVVASVGAINRGITYLEARGFGKVGLMVVTSKDVEPFSNGRVRLKSPIPDLLTVDGVYAIMGRERVPIYFELCPSLILEGGYDRYEIRYKKSIPRVSQLTSDDKELDICDGLCGLLPYFVKSELLANEDESEARGAKEDFERGVFEYEFLLGAGEPRETIYKHF